MATLPIFQKRGVGTSVVQDVSIAPQQAAISGMGSLDQAVSRMTAYFQSQAATDAKTAAVKYAAENPLTEDQVKTNWRRQRSCGLKALAASFNKRTKACRLRS